MKPFSYAVLAIALSTSACQAVAPVHGSFALAPTSTGGVAAVQGSQATTGAPELRAGTGRLVVRLADKLPGLLKRRVLATVADIDRVVVTLTADGQPDRVETVPKAALLGGQASVAFNALPAGTYHIGVKAYNAGGTVIGETSDTAAVAANAVTEASLGIVLTPSYAPPPPSGGSGGGGPATGGLNANTVILDGPSLLTPLPLLASLAPLATATSAIVHFGPSTLSTDSADNVWVGTFDGIGGPAHTLAKVAADGTVLKTVSLGTAVNDVLVDPQDNVWVALLPKTVDLPNDTRVVQGPTGVVKLAGDGSHVMDLDIDGWSAWGLVPGPGDKQWVQTFPSDGAPALTRFHLFDDDGTITHTVVSPTDWGALCPMTSDPFGNLWFTNHDDQYVLPPGAHSYPIGALPGKVFRYDVASSQLKTFDIGKGLIGIEADPFGRIWLSSRSEDGPNLTVLANNGSVVTTIPVAEAPMDLAFDRSGRAWCMQANVLTVYDPQTFALLKTYPMDDDPYPSDKRITFDAQGHLWYPNLRDSSVVKYAIQ